MTAPASTAVREAPERARAARPGSAGPSLTVSVVVYAPDEALLRDTLTSLETALRRARARALIGDAAVELVDNGSPGSDLEALLSTSVRDAEWLHARVVRGHGNVGYGRGHNLSIRRATSTYHLVLNPDVVLAPDAIAEAVAFMEGHREVALLTPHVEGPAGEWQSLARRAPTVAALGLRGFAPRRVRRLFEGYLSRYELRDRVRPDSGVVYDVPCATGCFMFARGGVLRDVGGFHDGYFLYFEDYDLSLTLGAVAATAYVPDVRVRHFGGDAARKGFGHVRLFVRSAVTFFARHGWRVV